jgi:hypothetical protein
MPITASHIVERLMGTIRLAAILTGLLLVASAAHAQGKVSAHYTIAMTGVTIGEIDWKIDIGDTLYSTSASGKASGVLSALMNGAKAVSRRRAILCPAVSNHRRLRRPSPTRMARSNWR